MSKKLTKEMLDALIKEVLTQSEQERLDERVTNYPFDPNNWKDIFGNNISNAGNADSTLKKRIKDLAKVDGTPADVTTKDVVDGASEPTTSNAYKAVVNIKKGGRSARVRKVAADAIAGAAAIAKAQAPATMGNIKNIDVDTQTYDPDSIAFGGMANIGSQMTGSWKPGDAVPLGKMQEGFAQAVQTFLGAEKTFVGRIKKISEFSKAVFSADKTSLDNMTMTEVLSASLIMDMITTIAREIDSGAGAYDFEALLANLAGGTVAGKADLGASTKGKMGGVDFVTNDGTLGSSKYYAGVGAGSVTQAATGFTKLRGKSTLYIIANKKDVVSGTQATTKVTSDPIEILKLDIYTVSVAPKVQKPQNASDYTYNVNGTAKDVTGTGDLDLGVLIKGSTPIELQIAKTNTNPFQEEISTGFARSTHKDLIDEFKQAFKLMYSGKQKAMRYSASGDTAVGNNALDLMNQADDKFIELAMRLSTTTKSKASIKTSRTLEEQKMKELDLMIENMVKHFIKGNLND